MLIGWEGADWRLMEPLLDSGQMPHLELMTEKGTMGHLASPLPLVCPILWTSIATGAYGDRHNILTPVEPDGCGDVRPVTNASRRRKALWNILSQSGLRSAVVGWPATHPAESIDGVVVSDRFPQSSGPTAQLWPADEHVVHPPELFDRIMRLLVAAEGVTPGQITSFIADPKKIAASRDPRVASVAMRIAQAASIQNAATWIIQNVEWDFMAVHFGMLGGLCHEFMKYKAPHESTVSDRDAELFGGVVDTGYRLYDKMLGRLLELAGEHTLVILVSDHGFNRRPIHLVPKHLEPVMEAIPCEPRYQYLRYHRRDAIFCATGPRVKKDDIIIGGRITDIAPTILASLGLPLPTDMDGNMLDGIFETAPNTMSIESYEPSAAGDGIHPWDLTDESWLMQEIIENLSALGFINLDPDRASALEVCTEQRQLNLAEIRISSGRINEALSIYRHLLKRDDSFSVRVPIIKCLIHLNRLDEAEKELESATFLLPFSATPNLLWAMLHSARGNLELAESYLDKAKDTDMPCSEVLVQLGALGLRLQRWEKARAFFERALEEDPLSVGAHDGLGRALLQMERIEESVFHHMQAVRLLYRSSLAHQHLGEALLAARQLNRAIRAFETAIELNPSNTEASRLLKRARLWREKGWSWEIDTSTDAGKGDTV